ncbi:MAG: DUF4276 family protein [Caldilineaceae bacterium]|nr:DUF4276 family protein [Caldilineaceae bacterium]
MVKVTVYVEGGGRGRLATECRRGFTEFFRNAGLAGHMPSIVACGSRNDAFDRFCVALNEAGSGEIPLLLVDSESPVQSRQPPWQHLASSPDRWNRPQSSREEQAHLMVQCMESWFMADAQALEIFFGAGFRLPTVRNDIEDIPKQDVLRNLETASRRSQKGAYHKGRYSFEILAQIDPEKVIQRSPFAKRLIDTLKSHLIPA